MSRKKKRNQTSAKQLLYLLLVVICVVAGYFYDAPEFAEDTSNSGTISGEYINSEDFYNETDSYISIEDIPSYSDRIYVTLNNNVPYFTEADYTTKSFETYSNLDSLGRCGVAYANICKEIMPTEERGDISDVYPTGWKQKKYDGTYLYNRCHLIGHQLAGEDANEKNLITGTRYFNVSGMLPFENEVADYIKTNQNNHVLYRVTPIYKDKNLVATGVQMEAYSVEDNGVGVCFNVFVYNVQPGISINYETGESLKD